MLTLPAAIVAVLVPFATLFTNPTWQKAQLLLVGAILTPARLSAFLSGVGEGIHKSMVQSRR